MKALLLFVLLCYILYSWLYAKENRGARKRTKSADTRMTMWLLLIAIILLIAFALV